MSALAVTKEGPFIFEKVIKRTVAFHGWMLRINLWAPEQRQMDYNESDQVVVVPTEDVVSAVAVRNHRYIDAVQKVPSRKFARQFGGEIFRMVLRCGKPSVGKLIVIRFEVRQIQRRLTEGFYDTALNKASDA